MSEGVCGEGEQIVKSSQAESDGEPPLTIERYAEAYRLHADDLAILGLKTIEGGVAIPYRDRNGQELSTRLLSSLHQASTSIRYSALIMPTRSAPDLQCISIG